MTKQTSRTQNPPSQLGEKGGFCCRWTKTRLLLFRPPSLSNHRHTPRRIVRRLLPMMMMDHSLGSKESSTENGNEKGVLQTRNQRMTTATPMRSFAWSPICTRREASSPKRNPNSSGRIEKEKLTERRLLAKAVGIAVNRVCSKERSVSAKTACIQRQIADWLFPIEILTQ